MRKQNIGHALSAPLAPPTQERPYRLDTDIKIVRPYVARASVAPSVDKPDGTTSYVKRYQDYSVMQQHCIYWDRDEDGVIWPYDTWIGFRNLGFNFIFSFLAVIVIHTALSLPSRLAMSWIPDPCFRIYLKSIHKDKHGSDSGIFDTEGRFIPSRFEDMWVKYTAPPHSLASADKLPPPKDTMTYNQLWNFIRGNRVAMDPFGWTASFLEWSVAFLLLQKDGMLHKEDVRMLLDGSMFFKVKAERESKRGWNQGFGLGGDGFYGGKRSLPFSI